VNIPTRSEVKEKVVKYAPHAVAVAAVISTVIVSRKYSKFYASIQSATLLEVTPVDFLVMTLGRDCVYDIPQGKFKLTPILLR